MHWDRPFQHDPSIMTAIGIRAQSKQLNTTHLLHPIDTRNLSRRVRRMKRLLSRLQSVNALNLICSACVSRPAGFLNDEFNLGSERKTRTQITTFCSISDIRTKMWYGPTCGEVTSSIETVVLAISVVVIYVLPRRISLVLASPSLSTRILAVN